MQWMIWILRLVCILVGVAALAGCSQEAHNKLGRAVQNWTGTDGVLDIYAGEKLAIRFIQIDKISTAFGTEDKTARPYRYGYGYVDSNFNYKIDSGEKKGYFEFSDYATNYVFYENPHS